MQKRWIISNIIHPPKKMRHANYPAWCLVPPLSGGAQMQLWSREMAGGPGYTETFCPIIPPTPPPRAFEVIVIKTSWMALSKFQQFPHQ